MPKDPEPRVVPDFSPVWDKDPCRFSCCGGSKRIGYKVEGVMNLVSNPPSEIDLTLTTDELPRRVPPVAIVDG